MSPACNNYLIYKHNIKGIFFVLPVVVPVSVSDAKNACFKKCGYALMIKKINVSNPWSNHDHYSFTVSFINLMSGEQDLAL